MWAVVVIYDHPKDSAAFERYYADVHVPLVQRHASEIGFSRAVLEKFAHGLDGARPKFYRKAELWFDSEQALRRGTGTSAFGTVAGDIPKFASGGFTVLVAEEA